MLRLAVKRNSFFALFIMLVAVFAAACGLEKSSSIPVASSSDCANYSYTSTSTVTLSPLLGYAYGADVPTSGTFTFGATTPPVKITITGGYPPFGVSAQSFVSMSLNYTGPFAFGTGFLSIAKTDAVSPINDPSCRTYVFWIVPEGTFGAGGSPYTDTLTITDYKGSSSTIDITITITEV